VGHIQMGHLRLIQNKALTVVNGYGLFSYHQLKPTQQQNGLTTRFYQRSTSFVIDQIIKKLIRSACFNYTILADKATHGLF